MTSAQGQSAERPVTAKPPVLPLAEDEILAQYRARTPGSARAWERARASLPGGVARTIAYHRPYPVFVQRGSGCRVVDLDGNEYVDFVNNYGGLVLGHAHPAIVAAMTEVIGGGLSFGSPIGLESELAEAVLARARWADRVRFSTSGSEAVMFALRLARAYTGRANVVKIRGSYHGLSETAMVRAESGDSGPVADEGIPRALAETVLHVTFNDVAEIEEVFRAQGPSVAAAIVEPVIGAGGMIPATPEYLRALRRVTESVGALLVVDEVLSFRLGYAGAHEAAGITPDLMTMGKIIGGGLPVGAIVGRGDVMELLDPTSERLRIYHSGTFSAAAPTLAAGRATLDVLSPEVIAGLNARGDRLRARLAALFQERSLPLQVTGRGSMFQIHVGTTPVVEPPSAAAKARFFPVFLALLNQGVMLTPRGSGYLSTAIGDGEVDALVGAVERVVAMIGDQASLSRQLPVG